MANVVPRVILGLLVLIGAVWVGRALLEPAPPPATKRRWTSSEDCRECHQEVYAEWEGSWHERSFVDPDVREQSNDFANTDCIDCHAPKPVFLTGVGKRVLPRAARRKEGVDCIACHLLPNGDVAGTITNPSAPCRPVATVELQRPEYCAVCHNQHGTVDQWRETPYAEEGTGCVECHMPFRDGDPGRGRHHAMLGGHDIELIRDAVALRARREGEQRVVVEVENHGVGHSYPTDERSRASDVWWRPVGTEDWHHLHRIRDPYRHEVDLPKTLLVHGETRVLEIDDPRAEGPVEVLLVYRLAPYYHRDGEAIHIEEVIDPLEGSPSNERYSEEVHRVTVE